MKISTALGLGNIGRSRGLRLNVAPSLASVAIALRESGPAVLVPVEPGAVLWAVAAEATGWPVPTRSYWWHLDGVLVAETASYKPTGPGLLVVTVRLDNGVWPAAEATSEPVIVVGEIGAGLPLAQSGTDVSLWIGAVTETSVTATARVSAVADTQLVVSTNESFSTQIHSTPMTPHADYLTARSTIDGLQPGTHYFIRTAVGGVIDTTRAAGRFRTPPAGAHSFSFGAASCAATGSNAMIFERLRLRAEAGSMDFFLHTGDLHYRDIAANDEALFHGAYDAAFAAARQNAAWRSMPMLYMWDDHDYGPDNSAANSPSREASVAAFRRRVPVQPHLTGAGQAVYYTFKRGRVRFAVLDGRSERVSGSIISQAQEDWLIGLMTAAPADEVLCIQLNVPWVTSQATDTWTGASGQRSRIAAAIKQHMPNRVFGIAGDAHSLAYFGPAHNPAGEFPVLQAAPLDRNASQKYGTATVTDGPYPPSGTTIVSQYGLVDVIDTGGDAINVRFRGMSVDRSTGIETALIDRTFTLGAQLADPPLPDPDPDPTPPDPDPHPPVDPSAPADPEGVFREDFLRYSVGDTLYADASYAGHAEFVSSVVADALSPTGRTARWGQNSGTGRYARRQAAHDWVAANGGSAGFVEGLLLMRLGGGQNTYRGAALLLNGAETTNNNIGFRFKIISSGLHIQAGRFDLGVDATLGHVAGLATDPLHWARYRMVPATGNVQLKVWTHGNSEPGWMYSGNIGPFMPTGLQLAGRAGGVVHSPHFIYLAVGFDAPAPMLSG